MQAIQFIKDHGVEKAKKILGNAGLLHKSYTPTGGLYHRYEMTGMVSLTELKRLVESVELVNSNGGWNGTKNTITLFQSSLDLGLYHGVAGVDAKQEIPKLNQAIADYDAIYSGAAQ